MRACELLKESRGSLRRSSVYLQLERLERLGEVRHSHGEVEIDPATGVADRVYFLPGSAYDVLGELCLWTSSAFGGLHEVHARIVAMLCLGLDFIDDDHGQLAYAACR